MQNRVQINLIGIAQILNAKFINVLSPAFLKFLCHYNCKCPIINKKENISMRMRADIMGNRQFTCTAAADTAGYVDFYFNKTTSLIEFLDFLDCFNYAKKVPWFNK